MRATIVDAYDSFTHIIYQYLRQLDVETTVVRSGVRSPAELAQDEPDFIVLGPGPGHPLDSGHVEIVRTLKHRVPLFGVCLGHQAIALAFGARIERAAHLMHGKTSVIAHDGSGALQNQAQHFRATRYHSFIVTETPEDSLSVTARATDDNYVMALRHRTLPIEGVQFHPESIATQNGLAIFQTFIADHATVKGIR